VSADDGAERSWPPVDYSVGRENIRQFVEASGERRVIYKDPEVSGEAGFRDVVAPPMFAAVTPGGRCAPHSPTPGST